MKRIITLVALATTLSATAQIPTRIETFPISSVRLGDSQFLKNQQLDIHYILGLDADRLLAPYLLFFDETATTEIYPPPPRDALPIWLPRAATPQST